MPDIRYLHLQFANALSQEEVPLFRAAVIEKTARSSAFFHNHDGKTGYHYRYPLIQYKSLRRKAGILCLETAIEAIYALVQQTDMVLRIGDRTEAFYIERLHLDYAKVEVTEPHLTYQIRDWQALNQENYRKYAALPDTQARLAFLEKILTGHLLAFAQGIGWQVPSVLKIRIPQFEHSGRRTFKSQRIETFSLPFEVNLRLPDYIGLGKGSSIGFGIVQRRRPATPADFEN